MYHLFFLPTAEASGLNPTGRWGHRAVYVESQQSMYVVGGEVSGSGSQITNEVLVLPLNSTSASWTGGPNDGLPAHAFASMAVQDNALIVVGGMTASCQSDSVAHSLDLAGSSWNSATPNNLRRRHGAAAAPISDSKIIVVGGIADKSTCHNSAVAYTAADELNVPLSSSSAVTSAGLPDSLTGSKLAVSDFAMAQAGQTLYLAGGQAADGTLVSLDTVGVWTEDGGWKSQKVTGDVPSGRLGATLVAHPTQDMLILYGGSEFNANAKSYAPSTLLATLDTKKWEWSKPSNIQATASNAVSYHTSVMTPSGVMITAFGMGPQGSPVSNLAYLDMRDSSSSAWSWQSEWSSSMLGGANGGAIRAHSPTHKSSSARSAAIAVPVVIGTLLLIPLCVWLWRRHQRNSRKRRLASHFSFSTQEDNGHFNGFDGGRVNRSAYPFVTHEPEERSSGSWRSDMRSAIQKVFRRGSSVHGVGDDGTIASREMCEVSPRELNEKDWEVIDFGLGRVDENRREATYTDLPRRAAPRASLPRDASPSVDRQVDYAMPIASTMPYTEEEESVGQLVDVETSPRLGSPTSDGQSPLINYHSGLSDAAADAAAVDDWNALQKSVQEKPAFRPASTSSRGSHRSPVAPRSDDSHDSYASAAEAPSLPPLEFSGSPVLKTRRLPQTPTGGSPRRVSGTSSMNGTRHLAGARRSSGRSTITQATHTAPMSPLHVVNDDDRQ